MKTSRKRQFAMRELENLHNIMLHVDELFSKRAMDDDLDSVETMVVKIRELQMELIELQYNLDPEVRQTVDELNEQFRKELAEIEWEKSNG